MLEVSKTLRHGDINFSISEKTDRETKAVKKFVVAEGETPGHLHEITAGEGTTISVIDGDTTYFEIIGDNAVIDHPEHGKVKFAPGVYKDWRERERDPFLGAIREVRD